MINLVITGLIAVGGYFLGYEYFKQKKEEKDEPILPPMIIDLPANAKGSLAVQNISFITDNKEIIDSLKTNPKIINGLQDASNIAVPPESEWVRVEADGKSWAVARLPVAPVGIGEAVRLAKANGWVLPSPTLVDAIWQAADLKLEPIPRQSNGTAAQMNSAEMNISQMLLIQKQINDSGLKPKLIAGTHKDVVSKNGVIGIYGWHRLNGKVIQGFYDKHAHGDTPGTDWKDYSQGLRPIKQIIDII